MPSYTTIILTILFHVLVATLPLVTLVFVIREVVYNHHARQAQEEAVYKFRSNPENVRLRDLLLDDIIQSHRYIKAEKKRAADRHPIVVQLSQRVIAVFEASQSESKILLEAVGIPIWLIDAKLALEDEGEGEDRDNGKSGEKPSL